MLAALNVPEAEELATWLAELEKDVGIAPTLERLGQLAEMEGNLEEALHLYEESYLIYERLGALNTANGQICAESLARVRQMLP